MDNLNKGMYDFNFQINKIIFIKKSSAKRIGSNHPVIFIGLY